MSVIQRDLSLLTSLLRGFIIPVTSTFRRLFSPSILSESTNIYPVFESQELARITFNFLSKSLHCGWFWSSVVENFKAATFIGETT